MNFKIHLISVLFDFLSIYLFLLAFAMKSQILIIKVIEILKYFATNEKWSHIWMCPMDNVWFYFIFIAWVNLSHKTEKFWFWNSLKYFIILWWNRCALDLRMPHGKKVWFCLIFIVWVHFSHKTERFQFWKPVKYFNIF